MTDPEILIFPTLDEAQAATAELLVTTVEAAVAERGRALLALSGGSGPPGVFQHLLEQPLFGRVPWEQISVVLADERYVPFSSPDSNYSQLRVTLLDIAPIPSLQVYPVATYYQHPAEAVAIYDRQLALLLEQHGGGIDVALLGMGPDGHTASLFPEHPALDAAPAALAAVVEGAPKPPPLRVTLTAAALNRARVALFLVAGTDKAPTVRAALRGPHDPRHIPAQLISPPAGRVTWLLDAAAAAEL